MAGERELDGGIGQDLATPMGRVVSEQYAEEGAPVGQGIRQALLCLGQVSELGKWGKTIILHANQGDGVAAMGKQAVVIEQHFPADAP